MTPRWRATDSSKPGNDQMISAFQIRTVGPWHNCEKSVALQFIVEH